MKVQFQLSLWLLLGASAVAAVSSTAATATATKSKRSRRRGLFGRRRSRTEHELKTGIAAFYDRSSMIWENVWGEHMHHGYYIPQNRKDHKQAQIDLIDKCLEWAGVTTATKMVDVGCGIGGSSRHIARKFGCSAEGITLSPYQANRGNELAKEQGLEDRCHFQVGDALNQPFEDNSFDLIWSCESGEHMPNKPQFIKELFRVTKPGGKILIITWCHRDLDSANGDELSRKEKRCLERINKAYYLPKWCSVADYVELFKQNNGQDIKSDDWSYVIAPFWKAVIRSACNPINFIRLMGSGFTTIRGAKAMLLMLEGYNMGLIKFGLITCTKADAEM